jgi:hypothetical protein
MLVLIFEKINIFCGRKNNIAGCIICSEKSSRLHCEKKGKLGLLIKHLVVAADGAEVSKYRCLVSSQGHREEIIADLFPQVKDPHGKRGITHGFFC